MIKLDVSSQPLHPDERTIHVRLGQQGMRISGNPEEISLNAIGVVAPQALMNILKWYCNETDGQSPKDQTCELKRIEDACNSCALVARCALAKRALQKV